MNLTSLLLPEDHDAVIALMDSYVRTWNAQNTDKLLDFFSDHAEFTGATGDIATGKPAIRRLLNYYFGVIPKSNFGFSGLYLRYLQPEMVMGTANWTFRSDDQHKPIDHDGILHFICLKTPEKPWKIILLHSVELSNQPVAVSEDN